MHRWLIQDLNSSKETSNEVSQDKNLYYRNVIILDFLPFSYHCYNRETEVLNDHFQIEIAEINHYKQF